jgi:hypothetical protein
MDIKRVQEFCNKMKELTDEINEFNSSGNTCEFRASHLNNRLHLIKIEIKKVAEEEGIKLPSFMLEPVRRLTLV